MLNYSVSEENYIKAIFHLQQESYTVSTNELSQKLNTKPASVTDMMKKLKAKKLLHYQPYRGFRLSADGNKVALGIIRRHRLWEYFLAEKLKFSWNEVHDIAEDLEHVSSKKLTDKLDEFLGFPKFDPHGDPIPDVNGKLNNESMISLANLPVNHRATVCKVSTQSATILELLKHKNIGIGTMVVIKKRFVFDDSLEVKTGRQPTFNISKLVAENIFVKHL
jgi:DtxR family Mn-dependent transcriptional regulator